MPLADFTDWFQAGAAIRSRLETPGLGLVRVDGLSGLADAIAGAKPEELATKISALYPQSPAAAVGYDGDVNLFDSEGGGQGRAQRWLVVLVVKNVADTAKNEALLAEAGPLVLSVFNSLSGWKTGIKNLGELRHVAGPRPTFGKGIGLFPLVFLVPLFLPGANHEQSY